MIVLDVESSGLDPKKNSMLSIGAVDLDEPENQFYDECRAWDGAELHPDALAVNGFSQVEARSLEKKSEAEVVAAFVAWATDRPKDRTLAAQNVSFDYEFVRAACERAGIDFPFAKRTIDVHTLAWAHMVGQGKAPPIEKHHSALSSKAIQEHCGIPEEPKPHNALTGAVWHAEAIARMAYNTSIAPEYAQFPIPWLKK
jgi:DNA polymerase III epsilon subunit-like protein